MTIDNKGKNILKELDSIPFLVFITVISSETIGVDPLSNSIPPFVLFSAFFINPKSFPEIIITTNIIITNRG